MTHETSRRIIPDMRKTIAAVAVIVSSLGSSTAATADVRLQLELYKNGALAGDEIVEIADGNMWSFFVDNVAEVEFTATRAGDRIVVAFTIASGGKVIKPRLVLRGRRPGAVSWTSADRADSFELRILAR